MTERQAQAELPGEIQRALKKLRAEVRGVRLRLLVATCCWSGGLAALLMGVLLALHGNRTGPVLTALAFLLIPCGVAMLPRGRRAALKEVARYRDVRIIGDLLDALSVSAGRDRYEIIHLLTNLLPLVTETDAPVFTRGRLRQLQELLRCSDGHLEVHLQVAVVRALSKIGDTGSLHLLRQLVANSRQGEYEHLVQNAARESVLALQNRIEAAYRRQDLLRPATGADPKDLLRIPVAQQDVASEGLLRVPGRGPE
ncbi:MAG: hypothetical protein NZ557_10980 [Chthonomonadaceae bacterium]|nr:hypothetical protein [Chthonomonadaceae bacterium]